MAIHVYSKATSLLVRKLPVSEGSSICAYTLSSVNADHLYLATSQRLIVLWDWVKGEKLARWETDSQIYSMTTSVSKGSSIDTVYTLERARKWMVTAHRLRHGTEAASTEIETLFESPERMTDFKVVSGGKFIVITEKRGLTIGKLKSGGAALKDFQYTWRSFGSKEPITAFDVRCSEYVPPKASTKGYYPAKIADTESVNILIGDTQGFIYVYEDLLRKLERNEKPRGPNSAANTVVPRILHWHREAVGAVKWSLDGKKGHLERA